MGDRSSIERGGVPRVMFVISSLQSGGFDNHWRDLILDLHRRGVPIHVAFTIGPGPNGQVLIAAGCEYASLDWPPDLPAWRRRLRAPWPIASTRWLIGEASSFEPTVIVTAGLHEQVTGSLAGRLKGIPTTLNWHGPPGQFTSPSWRLGRRIAAALGARAICISPSQMEEMQSVGFAADRITIIPNGIEEPAFADADRERLRRELGVEDGTILAVAVSRIAPEKNLERFVEAVARVGAERPSFRGVIVGDGDPASVTAVRDAIAATGSRVELVGWDPQPSRWIRAADIVCMTSDFETQPLTLIEAMACSRPFVAMESGGIRDLSDGGSTGKVVPAGDLAGFAEVLGQLCDDVGSRLRLGTAGRSEWESRYRHGPMVDRYLAELAELAGR